MFSRLKFVWAVLVDEAFLKSSYKGIGSDTLKKCLLMLAFSVGFYLAVYHYDAWATRFDHWLSDAFGWRLSTPPSEKKIEWHRTVAAGMSLIGIVSAVGEYSVCLWRRIKVKREQWVAADQT